MLFLLAINDIAIPEGIEYSIFADDVAIWKEGSNVKQLQKDFNNALRSIVTWSDQWGFKVSPAKTQVMLFTNKNVEAVVKVWEVNVKKSKSVKFLGMWFDKRLTWRDHVQFLREKCLKRLNVMRCLSGIKQGVNKETLVMLYKTFIRSCIDLWEPGLWFCCNFYTQYLG